MNKYDTIVLTDFKQYNKFFNKNVIYVQNMHIIFVKWKKCTVNELLLKIKNNENKWEIERIFRIYNNGTECYDTFNENFANNSEDSNEI